MDPFKDSLALSDWIVIPSISFIIATGLDFSLSQLPLNSQIQFADCVIHLHVFVCLFVYPGYFFICINKDYADEVVNRISRQKHSRRRNKRATKTTVGLRKQTNDPKVGKVKNPAKKGNQMCEQRPKPEEPEIKKQHRRNKSEPRPGLGISLVTDIFTSSLNCFATHSMKINGKIDRPTGDPSLLIGITHNSLESTLSEVKDTAAITPTSSSHHSSVRDSNEDSESRSASEGFAFRPEDVPIIKTDDTVGMSLSQLPSEVISESPSPHQIAWKDVKKATEEDSLISNETNREAERTNVITGSLYPKPGKRRFRRLAYFGWQPTETRPIVNHVETTDQSQTVCDLSQFKLSKFDSAIVE